jgi:hypothetical protein
MVTSTTPETAMVFAFMDCSMEGRTIFIPKITNTPKTTARVVKKVLNFLPAKYRLAIVIERFISFSLGAEYNIEETAVLTKCNCVISILLQGD